MGKRSRNKGKRGELEAAKMMKSVGWAARRGQQYSGGSGSGDLVTELDNHFHFEVKRTEALRLYDAMAQAKADAGGKIPVVMHRRNHCDWVVVLPAKDFLEMVRELDIEPNLEARDYEQLETETEAD